MIRYDLPERHHPHTKPNAVMKIPNPIVIQKASYDGNSKAIKAIPQTTPPVDIHQNAGQNELEDNNNAS